MKIPEYVKNLMERARYDYDTSGEKCAVGYTIKIDKRTPYVKAETLRAEILQLAAWVKRQGGEIDIHTLPSETRIDWQPAIVTIYDPIMQHLEKYIWAGKKPPKKG